MTRLRKILKSISLVGMINPFTGFYISMTAVGAGDRDQLIADDGCYLLTSSGETLIFVNV